MTFFQSEDKHKEIVRLCLHLALACFVYFEAIEVREVTEIYG